MPLLPGTCSGYPGSLCTRLCPFYFTSQSYPPEVPKEAVRDLDSGSPSAQAKGIFMVHKESYDFICQVVHEINMAK